MPCGISPHGISATFAEWWAMTTETPSSQGPMIRAGTLPGKGEARALASPILVVEDDQTTCDIVRAYLETAGHRVVICRTGGEALGVVRQTQPRCLILD